MFVLAWVQIGCQGGGKKPTSRELGNPFALGIGEIAKIDNQNLTLKFVEVIRDVRCPNLVNCAEDGPVEIAVVLRIETGEEARFEMNPEEVPEILGWAPNQVSFSKYLVELLSVYPHPEMPEDLVDFDNYQAMFMITLEE